MELFFSDSYPGDKLWWFHFFLKFHPCLGKMNPIWQAYFSDGLVQPPTRSWIVGGLCFCVCQPSKDDEIAAYRQRILGLVEDCLEVLTPNTALEHVLKSLLNGQQQGVVVPRQKNRCEQLGCVHKKRWTQIMGVWWSTVLQLRETDDFYQILP